MKVRKIKSMLCVMLMLCLFASTIGVAEAKNAYGRTTVFQSVTISNGTYTFDPEGGTAVYTLPSKTYELKSFSSNVSWITVTKKDSTSINIKVPKNENAAGRSGSVTVTWSKGSKTFTVKQTGNTLDVSISSKTVSRKEGSFSFTATPKVGYVSVSDNASWLSTSKSGNTITVKYLENPTLEKRSALITLSVGTIKKTVSVTQEGPTLQEQKDNDLWSKERETQLNAFYNNLIKGSTKRGDTLSANAISRAKTLSTFSWTCLKDIKCYLSSGKFEKDHRYLGAPYKQFNDYIGYNGVTIDDLIAKAKDTASDFYTSSTGPGCGTDCSGFVSYCLNMGHLSSYDFERNYRKSEHKITEGNKTKILQLISSGDILWRNKHVMLVASVIRENNTVKAIVILESRNKTTASARNIYVYYNDNASLRKLFGDISLSNCTTILNNIVGHTGTIDKFISYFDDGNTEETDDDYYLLDAN